MPGRSSLGQTLAVAALVHLAVFILAGRIPPPSPRALAPVAALDLIAIEVSQVAPTAAPPEPPDSVEPTPRAERPASEVPLSPATRPRTIEPQPAASALALPESGPETGAWTLRVTTNPTAPAPGSSAAMAALGLGGPNPFMGRRETPEDEARAAHEQANRAAGAAMRAAMHDHDVELGLGGGGPVVTALEAAVRDGMGGDEGRAVFVAVADASGAVLRVDVESASDEASFRAVADDLLRRMQGQHVRVPAGAHGLAMRVHVDSHLAVPSGGGAGLDPKQAGAHFDIADLGARPRRVIHARVLAEQVL
jgi:hypothetical protein